MATFGDMSELEAARQRMDDRVRRARRPRTAGQPEQYRISHQLRRATRSLRRTLAD